MKLTRQYPSRDPGARHWFWFMSKFYFFLETSFSGKYRHIPSSPTFWHFWVDDFPWGRHGEQRHASVERLDLLQWQLQGKGWEEMHLGMDSFQVVGWWYDTILKKRSQTRRVWLLEERSASWQEVLPTKRNHLRVSDVSFPEKMRDQQFKKWMSVHFSYKVYISTKNTLSSKYTASKGRLL